MRLTTVCTQLFPHLDSVRLDALEIADQQILISLSSPATRARCPLCQRWSRTIHSCFCRVLADLPCAGRAVRLSLSGHRFACRNSACPQRTFRERLPQVAPYYQRQTPPFRAALERLGFALGGRPAARLACTQGFPPLEARRWRRATHRADTSSGEGTLHDGVYIPAACGPSRAAFLRAVRAAPRGEPPTPRVLGVDDWAWRKGRTYGTLLVDLERHHPVDVLPDRTAETFAAWLSSHPGVESISRDRASAYADGAQQGAPQARQVADRFHLVKNLTDALEMFLLHKGGSRARAAQELASSTPPCALSGMATGGGDANQDTQGTQGTQRTQGTHSNDTMYRGRRRGERQWAQRQEQASQQRHARTVARHDQIHTLRGKGLDEQEIARRVGVCRNTVIRYLQMETAPSRRHWRQRRGRALDPYEPYLLRRWEEGCHSGRRLWQEIREQGYGYSLANVARFVAHLRREGPPPPVVQSLHGVRRQVATSLTSLHGPSARQTAFLLVRPASVRSPEETAYLDRLCQDDAEVAQAAELTTAFAALVREHAATGKERLTDWLASAVASSVGSLRRFAQGLRKDFAAVLAGLTLPINNGQLEGQVNRLKTIKRQMFGRANFELSTRYPCCESGS